MPQQQMIGISGRCGSPSFSREQAIKLLWMLELRRYLEDMGLASLA
jgi:hypothetical protein